MEAGDEGGVLVTRPVTFSGTHLFVNVDAPEGELRVDVLDGDKTVASSSAVKGDSTRLAVAVDLSAAVGKPVRFRLHLRKGKLYSFWVTSDPKGASGGYVAAGGPGYEGAVDRK